MTNEDFWSDFSYPYTIDGQGSINWSMALKLYTDNLDKIDNVPTEYTAKVKPIFDIDGRRQ